MFFRASPGGIRLELSREALQGHGAPVGFDEEIESAFGIPQAEEAVRGYWDCRVLIRERHLYFVLEFGAFAPEEELHFWVDLTSQRKYGADVTDEEGVSDVYIA